MKGLTPAEANKLAAAWTAAKAAFDALEDIRPAGGFREAIDPKYCRECGREKVAHNGAIQEEMNG